MIMEFLNTNELILIENILERYGNDETINSVSELDGYFTALISGPEVVLPSRWYPALWGKSCDPEWDTKAEFESFFQLLFRHMNSIVTTLMKRPETFHALRETRYVDEGIVPICDDWCFGYMRGVALGGGWVDLPPALKPQLRAIELYGLEDNYQSLIGMTKHEREESAKFIELAVRTLHAYWLEQRSALAPVRAKVKIGRNEPCPCGSGKKLKQCCLH
jgi:uncharacterized protein